LWHCAPWNLSIAYGGKEFILITSDFVLPNQSLVYSLILWFTSCLTKPRAFRCLTKPKPKGEEEEEEEDGQPV